MVPYTESGGEAGIEIIGTDGISFDVGVSRRFYIWDVQNDTPVLATLPNSQTLGVFNREPSYTLDVGGVCAASSFANKSDIRKKDVIENIDGINIEDIANSPIFTFKWKDDKDCTTHIGTSAQYWKGVLPNAVYEANDDIGTLSMEYGTASLASVISLAKKTVELEKRIKVLEGN